MGRISLRESLFLHSCLLKADMAVNKRSQLFKFLNQGGWPIGVARSGSEGVKLFFSFLGISLVPVKIIHVVIGSLDCLWIQYGGINHVDELW